MRLIGMSVRAREDGEREVTITALLSSGEEMEQDDVANLIGVLEEASGNSTTPPTVGKDVLDEEAEPEKPKRRRRSKKAEEEPEAEPEAEEEPKRRRRRSKKVEEPEAEPEADGEEEPEEKPKRRRRRTKAEMEEPKGPTKEDVAKAASSAAAELGSKLAAEIVMDYSDDGSLEGIPEDKRQEYIDDVNSELGED